MPNDGIACGGERDNLWIGPHDDRKNLHTGVTEKMKKNIQNEFLGILVVAVSGIISALIDFIIRDEDV